jgi:hypothetical protein
MSQKAPSPEQQKRIDAIDRSPIAMQEVKSSQIAAIGYDEATQTLAVRYLHGGRLYHYGEVTPQVYAELMAAKSVGHYVQNVIKDPHRFPYTPIAEHQPAPGAIVGERANP